MTMTNTTTFYRPSDSPVTDRIGRLYIDMKATGPNRRRKDEVWQFAYIYEGPDGLLVSGNHYIQHSMRPTKWVMDHTSYDKVDPKMFRPPSEAFVELFDFSIPESDPEQVYIYAAQPSFAESFLQRYLQYYNLLSVQYERQLMCIESYVAGALHLKFVPTLDECAELLAVPRDPSLFDAASDVNLAHRMIRAIDAMPGGKRAVGTASRGRSRGVGQFSDMLKEAEALMNRIKKDYPNRPDLIDGASHIANHLADLVHDLPLIKLAP